MNERTVPLVSVVIPCLDMGEPLAEAVESVRLQTYPSIEIVIVDDGSTDPVTLGLIDQFEREGILVIRQSNHGVGAAMNRGLEEASGRYFMPVNDDLIEPPYIAEAVEALEGREELGVVYSRATMFGTESGPWELPDFEYGAELLWNLIFSTSLFRLEDWRDVGGYDEVMRGREDHDFVLRVLGLGRTVHRLDGVYFHYRRGRASVNDRLHAPSARPLLIDAYARMFRNNTELYRQHADAYMRAIFRSSTSATNCGFDIGISSA